MSPDRAPQELWRLVSHNLQFTRRLIAWTTVPQPSISTTWALLMRRIRLGAGCLIGQRILPLPFGRLIAALVGLLIAAGHDRRVVMCAVPVMVAVETGLLLRALSRLETRVLRIIFFAALVVEGTMPALIFGLVLRLLLAIGHDDAVIVLCVLQIVLRQNRITRSKCIARQRHVLFGDVRGGAPNFHIWTVRFEAPRQGILMLACRIRASIVWIIVTPTATTVLLSLPHRLLISTVC